MGFGGKFYTPQQTSTYEREIAIMGSLEMGAEGPCACPFRLDIRASFTAPKGLAEARRVALLGQPATSKIDWDNVGKIVSDALNGIVWTDDRFVSIGNVSKVYALSPGLEISIWKL